MTRSILLSNSIFFFLKLLLLFLQQMDNSVYTFEQLFNQSIESQGQEDMCKTIQRCQDRVLKVKWGRKYKKHVLLKRRLAERDVRQQQQ